MERRARLRMVEAWQVRRPGRLREQAMNHAGTKGTYCTSCGREQIVSWCLAAVTSRPSSTNER
jgi:hypothetical protein